MTVGNAVAGRWTGLQPGVVPNEHWLYASKINPPTKVHASGYSEQECVFSELKPRGSQDDPVP